MNAAFAAGGAGAVMDDGPQVNMREYLKAHAERRREDIVMAATAMGKIIPIKRG